MPKKYQQLRVTAFSESSSGCPLTYYLNPDLVVGFFTRNQTVVIQLSGGGWIITDETPDAVKTKLET